MSDKQRQKIIFVNDTNVNNDTEQVKLNTISKEHSNVVFFTNRQYPNNELLDNSFSYVNHDIIIGGKSYIPVKGVSPKKSAVSVNDKLFTLSLDSNTGLLKLGVENAIEDISVCSIFYPFKVENNNVHIYNGSDYLLAISSINNEAITGGAEFYDKANLYNSDGYSLDADNHNLSGILDTICIMTKIEASKNAINGVDEGPELILYSNNESTNTRLDISNYISEINTLKSSTLANMHRKPVAIERDTTTNRYVSYIPYFYNIRDFINTNGAISGCLKHDTTRSFYVQTNINFISPIINKFELVEVPTNDTGDYSKYSNAKHLSYQQIIDAETGTEKLVTHIDLSKITLKIIPDRTEYTNYDNLLNNVKYDFTGINIEYINEYTNDKVQLPTDAYTYNPQYNQITFKVTHINTIIPLKNYIFNVTLADSNNSKFNNDQSFIIDKTRLSCKPFYITKLNDAFLMYLHQSTTAGNTSTTLGAQNELTASIQAKYESNTDQFISINHFNDNDIKWVFHPDQKERIIIVERGFLGGRTISILDDGLAGFRDETGAPLSINWLHKYNEPLRCMAGGKMREFDLYFIEVDHDEYEALFTENNTWSIKII